MEEALRRHREENAEWYDVDTGAISIYGGGTIYCS